MSLVVLPPYLSSVNPATDPFFANVIALLHMEGVNGGTSFVEVKGKTVTRVGSPITSTSAFKFGSSSAKFNGSTDYLTLPSAAGNAYGTGDFTIEMFIHPLARSAVAVFIAQCDATSSSGISLYVNSAGNIVVGNHNAQQLIGNTAVPLNVWTHVALVRQGTSMALYQNGVQTGSVSNSSNLIDQMIWIGNGTEGAYWFNGYIDELRLTKGVARYNGNFTPTILAFPNS